MLYDNRTAVTFLEGRPVTEERRFYLLQEYKEADPERGDTIQELDSQLESIVEESLTFNKELFEVVFPNYREQLGTVCTMTIAGIKRNHIVKSEEGLCILIDLIHIAGYTYIIPQITYILQNYLTLELLKYLIQGQSPMHSRKYLNPPNHLAFINSFANYLAWSASCSNYKFYTQKHETHKERVFGPLSQVLQVETRALQHRIPVNAVIQEFWNQLPSVAGMFYFDDICCDLGKEGIVLLYRHRPKNSAQTIPRE